MKRQPAVSTIFANEPSASSQQPSANSNWYPVIGNFNAFAFAKRSGTLNERSEWPAE